MASIIQPRYDEERLRLLHLNLFATQNVEAQELHGASIANASGDVPAEDLPDEDAPESVPALAPDEQAILAVSV